MRSLLTSALKRGNSDRSSNMMSPMVIPNLAVVPMSSAITSSLMKSSSASVCGWVSANRMASNRLGSSRRCRAKSTFAGSGPVGSMPV